MSTGRFLGLIKPVWQRLGRAASAILLCGAVGCASSGAAPAKPNFVFIFTDDQAPLMTGFEGNTVIRTPNLDRLAAESLFFTRAYCPTGQCAPSRASVLTGQYPHTHGVVTNGPPLQEDAVTFSQVLKDHGYATGMVGKWHLPYASAGAPGFGFEDYVATAGHGWKWHNSPVFIQGQKTKTGKFLTDLFTDHAIEFIAKYHDQPFLLWLCYRAPHGPLVYPPGYGPEIYPPAKMPVPASFGQELKDRPATVRNSLSARDGAKMTRERLQQWISKYYSMISKIDEGVGRVLTELDTRELTRKTVVIFACDNGWTLGEHGLLHKGPLMYEELVRGPLLIRYPPVTGKGAKVDRVVSLVDLAPTICALAGAKAPPAMQGRSLVPLIKNAELASWDDRAFLEYHTQKGKFCPARGVVTERYKYVDYLQDSDELYDLASDPREMRNLIDEPGYQDKIEHLRRQLADWRQRTNDPMLVKVAP